MRAMPETEIPPAMRGDFYCARDLRRNTALLKPLPSPTGEGKGTREPRGNTPLRRGEHRSSVRSATDGQWPPLQWEYAQSRRDGRPRPSVVVALRQRRVCFANIAHPRSINGRMLSSPTNMCARCNLSCSPRARIQTAEDVGPYGFLRLSIVGANAPSTQSPRNGIPFRGLSVKYPRPWRTCCRSRR